MFVSCVGHYQRASSRATVRILSLASCFLMLPFCSDLVVQVSKQIQIEEQSKIVRERYK